MTCRLPLLILVAAAASAAAQADKPETIRIGIPAGLFRDVPPALLPLAGQTFGDLMKAQTGLRGEVVSYDDAFQVANDLASGKIQLGVLFGHEFAWIQPRFRDFEPLVVSVPRPARLQAFLVVRWDCKARHLGDLKGQKLTIPATSRDHALLFLDRQISIHFPDERLATVPAPDTIHDGIHQVLHGEADVVIVDAASWESFRKLYPGPAQNLRILAESDPFPPTVIIHHKGQLDEASLKRIRDGLLTAHDNPKCVRLMTPLRVDRFELPPADYAQALKTCRQHYPRILPKR